MTLLLFHQDGTLAAQVFTFARFIPVDMKAHRLVFFNLETKSMVAIVGVN